VFSLRPLSPPLAVLWGALVVGVLDALDAIVVFGLHSGTTPGRIFRGIAGGLIGPRAAAAGGTGTALLGVLLHFTVACGIVTACVLVSGVIPVLARRPWLFGPVFGVAAYCGMTFVVVPLSAIGGGLRMPATFGLVNGLIIHATGVGIPAALAAHRAFAAPR
jgi:hypothetical protein